jgi:hypothetical protein
MVFVRVLVGDSLGSISNGMDEGNNKGKEGCAGVVTETEATTFQGQVGNEGGKVWKSSQGV